MESEFMGGTVDLEQPVHVDLGFALRADMAIDAIRSEYGVRVTLAFENLFMHAVVARSAAACATRHINSDFARSLARFGVELNAPVFEFEDAVHCMKRVVQRESDFRFGWVKLIRLLRRGDSAQ
jgi:hypothetical protein